jgi:transposase InsO family protein
MPWNEVTTVKLRAEFVRLAQSEGANISQLCERFQISRKTGYKWLARFRSHGDSGLGDQSRRPAVSPSQTPSDVEADVLRLRDQHPAWGGRKIHARLVALNRKNVPAPSTITAILRRHGRIEPDLAVPRAFVRFERDRPNELWQMDFKGHFPTASGRCHPLTVLDDHSRYCVGLHACTNERDDTVQAHLTTIFRCYGLPERILCDNGPPWGTAGAETKWTGLTVWLLKLGVRVSHGRAFHPQTQGKDERFHRTLDVEVIQRQVWSDVAACQRRFDPWRQIYNHERPHEALNMEVPGSRYRVSERVFPEVLREWEYGASDAVRKVSIDGTISYRGHALSLGKAFRGERVAVRPTTTDGVLKIFFGVHEIVEFDLREQNRAAKSSLSASHGPYRHASGVGNLPCGKEVGAAAQACSAELS